MISNIDFIFLYTILFGAFASIAFTKQRFIDKNYWSYLSIFIILFTLIVGLRYGWGNDYLSYKYRIEHPAEDEDVFYGLTNKILREVGFNYITTYMLYAFLLITGAFKLIRCYPDNRYMLALFLPAMFFIGTSTIRQGFATSFLLFAIAFLYKKKWIEAFVATFLSVNIHTAILIPILLFIGFYALTFVWKKPLPWKIVLPLYIVCAFNTDTVSTWFVGNFENSFDWLSNFGKFESYSDKSSYWFGEEGLNSIYEQSTFALVLSILFHSAYIYIGYKALALSSIGNVHRNVLYLYNTTIIGLFVFRIGMLLEIIHRIGDTLFAFYFIPLGFALSTYNNKWQSLKKKERKRFTFALVLIMCYIILYYGRFIIMSPGYMFVWN